jgi:hypothetical protein
MSTTTRATPLTFGRARLHAPEPPFVYVPPPDEAAANAAWKHALVWRAAKVARTLGRGGSFTEGDVVRAVADYFGVTVDSGWANRLLRSLDYVEPHPWRSGWRFRGVATRPG